jgi:hypothetical protein
MHDLQNGACEHGTIALGIDGSEEWQMPQSNGSTFPVPPLLVGPLLPGGGLPDGRRTTTSTSVSGGVVGAIDSGETGGASVSGSNSGCHGMLELETPVWAGLLFFGLLSVLLGFHARGQFTFVQFHFA